MKPNLSEEDVLRIEKILFTLWGDGRETEYVFFEPFCSYFGAEQVSDFTDYMHFSFGHICQEFFGHTKTPGIRQIRKVYRLLFDASKPANYESREVIDGRNMVRIKYIQNVKASFISFRPDTDDAPPFSEYSADDIIQVAFYKPYFNEKVAALKST